MLYYWIIIVFIYMAILRLIINPLKQNQWRKILLWLFYHIQAEPDHGWAYSCFWYCRSMHKSSRSLHCHLSWQMFFCCVTSFGFISHKLICVKTEVKPKETSDVPIYQTVSKLTGITLDLSIVNHLSQIKRNTVSEIASFISVWFLSGIESFIPFKKYQSK